MKSPLIFLSLIVITTITNAEELKSFLEVRFGEPIQQDKFASVNDALKNRGKSPSDVFRDTYIYKLKNKFKTYNEVLVKANTNGRVYYIGVIEFFKEAQRSKMITEYVNHVKWIRATYGKDTIQITDKTNPELYNKLKEKISNPSTTTTAAFFGFTSASGNLSQIITSSIVYDYETGDGVLAMIAEDIPLANATDKSSDENQSLKYVHEETQSPQLTRAKTLLAQNKKRKLAENIARQKGLESFCGIDFGSVINGEMYRTDGGRYLTCRVQLKTPFRGHEIARVYACVGSKRIFRIDIEGLEFECLSGGPITTVVSKRYGFKPESHTDLMARVINAYYWKFSNSQISFYFDYDNRRGVKLGDSFNKSGVLSATNLIWKHLADEEFEKESGGDGSSVL